MTENTHRVPADSIRYEIRVLGRLDPRWRDWFDGMTLTAGDDGTTALRGAVADQAALHGTLRKIRDLGPALVSVSQLDPLSPTRPRSPEGP